MANEYKLLSDTSLHRIEAEVNMAIQGEKWQPLGGISTLAVKLDDNYEVNEKGTITVLYTQALIR